jgi:hypothetical protein
MYQEIITRKRKEEDQQAVAEPALNFNHIKDLQDTIKVINTKLDLLLKKK